MPQVFDYVSGFDTGNGDAEGFFGDIVHAVTHPAETVSSIGHAAGNVLHKVENIPGIGNVIRVGEDVASKVVELHKTLARKLTQNPVWNIAQTGVAFIPGIGQGVSSGMATAAAVGRGESITDIGLAAARGALPGPAQIALDIGLGAVKGHGLAADLLHQVRAQLPVSEADKGAFDAGVAIAHDLPTAQVEALRGRLSSAQRAIFDRVVTTHVMAKMRQPPLLKSAPTAPGRTSIRKIPITRRPPNLDRAFPHLGPGPNRIAGVLLRNGKDYRTQTAAQLTTLVPGTDGRDSRTAIAAFLERFSKATPYKWTDVGDYDSIDVAAKRLGVPLPSDLSEWPSDTGAVEVLHLPPVVVSRPLMLQLYRRGNDNMKKAILAHAFLAHQARNTGELTGTTWTVRQEDLRRGLWGITEKLVGNGARWKEIVAVNPGMRIYTAANGQQQVTGFTVGRQLQIPPGWLPGMVPIAAPAAPTPSAVVGGPPFSAPSVYPAGYPSPIYVVKSGDTGEKIAEAITGNKSRWPELVRANPTTADKTYGLRANPGQRLNVPQLWRSAIASPAVAVTIQPVVTQPITMPGGAPDWTVIAPAAPPPTAPAPPVSVPPLAGGVVASMPSQALPPPPIATDVTPGLTPSAPAGPATQTAPAVIASQTALAALQLQLAAFYSNHPDAKYLPYLTTGSEGGAFGSSPEDLAGVWNERTKGAIAGFQLWSNATNRTKLHTDGLPDADTVNAIQKVTAGDHQTQAPTPIGQAPSAAAKKGDDLGALGALGAAALLFL